MKTEIETKTWALCPSCSGRLGTIDHLEIGSNAGPWFCDECGRGWCLTRTADGIDHREFGSETKQRTIVTLVLPPQKEPVVFTLDTFRVVGPDSIPDGDEYFYNEHTCAINWLRHVTEVRIGDDNDPHGLFRWVSTEVAPPAD